MPLLSATRPAAAHLRPSPSPTAGHTPALTPFRIALCFVSAAFLLPCRTVSSTFPPFAPSRIAWLNQAILAIPPFPCENPVRPAQQS